MPIEFNCHVCGKLLRTSDDKAGRTAKCPGCGESLTVPEDEFGGDDYETNESEFDQFGAVPTPSARSGATKACPMCGEQISASSSRCRFCGEDVGGGYSSSRSASYQPHRGAMILTFSILSFVISCPIFGIVALVMANEDLNEIAAGRMDPEGEGVTRAGKIISIVNLVLTAIFILLSCAFFVLITAAGGM